MQHFFDFLSNFFDSLAGLFVAMGLTALLICGAFSLFTPSQATKIEFAKAGLQECPNPEAKGTTIWLRECLPTK